MQTSARATFPGSVRAVPLGKALPEIVPGAEITVTITRASIGRPGSQLWPSGIPFRSLNS